MTATSGAALLNKIKPQLRRVNVHVCLRPDLLAQHKTEQKKMLEMMNRDAEQNVEKRRLGETGQVAYADDTQAQAELVQRLEDQIEKADVIFVMEALPKDEWNAHTAQYPPRKDNHFDMLAGYDRDAALDGGVRMCLIDPEFEDCPSVADPTIDCNHIGPKSACKGGSWEAFMRVCAASEWEELKNGVAEANTQTGENPGKSALASRVLASSAAVLKSPASMGSRSARSTAGRRGR